MNPEDALRTHLLADPDIITLGVTKMYPLDVPLGATYPTIVYQRISTRLLHVAGYEQPRIQFSCWGQDAPGKTGYAAARDLAYAVERSLEGFHGEMSGVHLYCDVRNRWDDFTDEDTHRVRVCLDVMVLHRP